MQNEGLLFQKNDNIFIESKIKCKLKFSKDKRFIYNIGTDVFTGDHILEILSVISYIKKIYKQKIPITFIVSRCEFYDKLVYVILESIFYYLYKDMSYDAKIIISPKFNIYTEGLNESPLRNMENKLKYIHDFERTIGRMHYRRLVSNHNRQKLDYLSNMMQEIEAFLINTGIEETVAQHMKEVLIELIGNSAEHGDSECLIDIDVTDKGYTRIDRNDKDTYYGMNVAIMNYSPVLFYEPLKRKMESNIQLTNRYELVNKAREYHFSHLTDNYLENDFYTLSSFQHRISGSIEKNEIGGTGLTSLLQSIEDQADNHLCYMLTGNRIIFFEKDQMEYDSNKMVSFNRKGNYLDAIPDDDVFQTISTFFPGVAYNLNYAFMKEMM